MKILYLSTIAAVGIAISVISTWLILGMFEINETSTPNLQSSGNPKVDRIDTLKILGMSQTYKIHQPIDFTISWTGFWSKCKFPDVQIVDSQNMIVWTMNQPLILCGAGYGHNGFISSKMIGDPILNYTNTYTMITIMGNKTAQQSFNVTDAVYVQTSPVLP